MTRRATIRTAHADPETIAAAIAPDNTDEMRTRVERDRDTPSAGEGANGAPSETTGAVVTTIERDSTSGLQSTVDDTLVNLAVADRVATVARGDAGPTSHGDASDSTTDDSRGASTPEPTDDVRETTRAGPTDDSTETTRTASTDDRPTTDTNDTS